MTKTNRIPLLRSYKLLGETNEYTGDPLGFLQRNQEIHGAVQSIKREMRKDDGAIGRVMVGGLSGGLLATVASCGTGATIAGVLGGAAIGGVFKDAVEVCKNCIQYSSV